jgi:hypothetical protein
VRDRIAENEAVFKRLQATLFSAADERRIAHDGLKSKTVAKSQIVKDLGDDFGILADGRVDRNTNFHGRAESTVDEPVAGDELIDGVTCTYSVLDWLPKAMSSNGKGSPERETPQSGGKQAAGRHAGSEIRLHGVIENDSHVHIKPLSALSDIASANRRPAGDAFPPEGDLS